MRRGKGRKENKKEIKRGKKRKRSMKIAR